ncbi:MAG: hypothetical protein JSV26_01730 [bacterium]|nr:MAG: hypothetical protein JSV26_01730 [bacterium]
MARHRVNILPWRSTAPRVFRTIPAGLAAIVTLSVSMSACSRALVAPSDPSADLAKAQQYLASGSYHLSEAYLDPYLEQDLDTETASKVHFTLGLAVFYSVRDDLERQSQGIGRAMGFLSERQVDDLLEAAAHFSAAVRHNPLGNEAPEALYLLGVIHDIGYLQRFEEAMIFYRRCLDEYPDTEGARRAEERFRILEEIYGGIKGTSHGR